MNALPSSMWTVSLVLLALALLAVAGLLIAGDVRRARHGQLIRRAIHRSAAALADPPAAADAAADDSTPRTDMALPLHWLNSRAGRLLVGDEDRRLIDQCGLSPLRAQWIFLVARIVFALGLPVLAWFYWELSHTEGKLPLVVGVAFGLGFMAPKWLLRRRAAQRKEKIVQELPLFVDLLRLLQGVGLSLDQSMQIMASEFQHVLPALGHELTIANRQYAQGRTREHSLQRLATLHDNENLAGLVLLLVQVDRHGGAVQEPLKAFSERLREQRRSQMKEHIGKVTVKMTGVMVITLLPALLIVTAGPGFLAVIRSLATVGN